MTSDEEEEEESDSKEWRSDVITHNDFDFDESCVSLKVRCYETSQPSISLN